MDEFRKKMLDYTTPEQRAKFDSGMQMFNDRRKARLAASRPSGLKAAQDRSSLSCSVFAVSALP